MTLKNLRKWNCVLKHGLDVQALQVSKQNIHHLKCLYSVRKIELLCTVTAIPSWSLFLWRETNFKIPKAYCHSALLALLLITHCVVIHALFGICSPIQF